MYSTLICLLQFFIRTNLTVDGSLKGGEGPSNIILQKQWQICPKKYQLWTTGYFFSWHIGGNEKIIPDVYCSLTVIHKVIYFRDHIKLSSQKDTIFHFFKPKYIFNFARTCINVYLIWNMSTSYYLVILHV